MTQDFSGWKKGCLIYGVVGVAIIGLLFLIAGVGSNDDVGVMAAAVGWVLWFLGAIPGLILLAKKKRFSPFGQFGCVMFILVGWWALILLLACGPLVWLAAVLLKAKKVCPSCKEAVDGDAARCPYCTSEIPA